MVKRRKASNTGRRAWRSVILKLSGEALGGRDGFGINAPVLERIAGEIARLHRKGVRIGIVIGGGNIFRGAQGGDIERTAADYMGMLATAINSLALQDALERCGVSTRVMSAIEMAKIAEPYIRRRAMRHFQKKLVVIFAGGTGNPYFSTDTAAALRASETRAEVVLKATKVDGVYDSDPVRNPRARKFDVLTYREAITRRLKVMDISALTMCEDNKVPIVVFNLNVPGNIIRAAEGRRVGTLVMEG